MTVTVPKEPTAWTTEGGSVMTPLEDGGLEAWSWWAKTWGPRVQGLGGDAAAFLRNLQMDNRYVYGPTFSGDRWGSYNTEDPKWERDKMPKIIGSVGRRLPRWYQSRGLGPWQ